MDNGTYLNGNSLRWIVSTNTPDYKVAMFYALTSILILAQGLYYWLLPHPWASIASAIALAGTLGAILTAVFLFRESRVHAEAFPKGSQCSIHSEELAYDRCAICGQLFCTKCLVRIKPAWSRTIGLFRFNGVACKACAYHRVKWWWLFGLSIWLFFLPPLVLFINLNPMLFYPQIDPAEVIFLVRGATLTCIIIAIMMTLSWWLQGKTTVMPSLSQQPQEMVDIDTRIVEMSLRSAEPSPSPNSTKL
ncbi:MAG: hypothetical protein Q6364_06800 [Candidatus Hermodarchaeota archaeon]|nr:hypothetical protein [Candidatus Hermodarchaeota archaeon]